MQRLARDGYSDEQIRSLLLADSLDLVAEGVELLRPDLTVLEDLGDDVVGWTATRTMLANIHGALELEISRSLPWGTALVRPYQVFRAGQVTARFNAGVYALTSPTRPVGEDPVTYTVRGSDRLYLLDRPVGLEYTASGPVLAAVRKAAADAGLLDQLLLDGTASAKALPRPKTWTLLAEDSSGPTTWLRVINDLLLSIGYRGIYADENGRLRSEPYVHPDRRPSEFTFDADDPYLTIVGQSADLDEDVWDTPNRWVFVQANPASGATPLQYEVTNLGDGPKSIAARGVINKVVQVDAADLDSLRARGDSVVAEDRAVEWELRLTTGPFPVAGHFDVFTYRDARVANRKVQAVRWQMSSGGSDVAWTWQGLQLETGVS